MLNQGLMFLLKACNKDPGKEPYVDVFHSRTAVCYCACAKANTLAKKEKGIVKIKRPPRISGGTALEAKLQAARRV